MKKLYFILLLFLTEKQQKVCKVFLDDAKFVQQTEFIRNISATVQPIRTSEC
jgi:hypothetical protein